jgi:hypothetical protein
MTTQRDPHAIDINRRGPKYVTSGTVVTTSSMDKGINAIKKPTHDAEISRLRAKRTSAFPTIHCQEITLNTIKYRNWRGARSSSRKPDRIGIFKVRVLQKNGNSATTADAKVTSILPPMHGFVVPRSAKVWTLWTR